MYVCLHVCFVAFCETLCLTGWLFFFLNSGVWLKHKQSQNVKNHGQANTISSFGDFLLLLIYLECINLLITNKTEETVTMEKARLPQRKMLVTTL